MAILAALHWIWYSRRFHAVNNANKLPRLSRNTSGSLNNVLYKELYHVPPVSKDLIVHSTYFDDRPRQGHENVTMIFFSSNRTIATSKWITGCGVGSTAARKFLVRPTYQQASRRHKYPYEQYVLECYDLPVTNESTVFVMYKTAQDTAQDITVKSESKVVIPAPRVQPTGDKYNFTVATCTKAFNSKVTYLSEFVRYQRTLGVDHVHLSVLDEFVRDGSFQNLVMQNKDMSEALNSGYLTFDVQKVWYAENETFLYSSVYQRLGCFFHFRGTYDYISIADPDDFFTPRITGITDIKHYIQEYCTKGTSSAGSCRFEWRWVYPDVCGVTGKIGEDGNVTDTVKVSKVERYDRNRKSIHSTRTVLDFSFHDAECKSCLLPGHKVVDVAPEIAYFIHNRLNSKRSRKHVCSESP